MATHILDGHLDCTIEGRFHICRNFFEQGLTILAGWNRFVAMDAFHVSGEFVLA